MASKSNPKKAPAEKSSKGYPIERCGWCDKYGEMKTSVESYDTSFGRQTDIVKKRYYCNRNCCRLHSRQERTINISKSNDELINGLQKIRFEYKDILKYHKDDPKKMKRGEYLFSEIKCVKAIIDFNLSLLGREKKDILTMKRYKCLKLAGDVYETIQGLDLPSTKHDVVLSYVAYFNDHIDKYGNTKLIGAVADVAVFGTD